MTLADELIDAYRAPGTDIAYVRSAALPEHERLEVGKALQRAARNARLRMKTAGDFYWTPEP